MRSGLEQAAYAERAEGPLVPGMPNLHSHAFQRAIAGRTGRLAERRRRFVLDVARGRARRSLHCVDAYVFAAIAAQSYVEMLKAGYTTASPSSTTSITIRRESSYADPAELARRIVGAAHATSRVACATRAAPARPSRWTSRAPVRTPDQAELSTPGRLSASAMSYREYPNVRM